MECSPRVHQPPTVFRFQHCLHIACSKCKEISNHSWKILMFTQVLLFLVTTPTYLLLLAANKTVASYTVADTVFPRVLAGLVFLSYLADGQQWSKLSSWISLMEGSRSDLMTPRFSRGQKRVPEDSQSTSRI